MLHIATAKQINTWGNRQKTPFDDKSVTAVNINLLINW